jgi:predicted metal-binding membrane protein
MRMGTTHFLMKRLPKVATEMAPRSQAWQSSPSDAPSWRLAPPTAPADQQCGGAILIAAAIYQWTPLKDVCLAQCQTPLLFLMRHGGFRDEALGCLLLGLRHGAYCIGCCWVLMALLFVGGVMNVLWIALLALLILFEKLFRFGRWIARASGIVFLAAGTWLLILKMA